MKTHSLPPATLVRLVRAACWHHRSAAACEFPRCQCVDAGSFTEAVLSALPDVGLTLGLKADTPWGNGAAVKALVDRFLAWELPKSVCSDACVSMPGYSSMRYGTNLLTADEAQQMVEHLLADSGLLATPEEIELRKLVDDAAAKTVEWLRREAPLGDDANPLNDAGLVAEEEARSHVEDMIDKRVAKMDEGARLAR